MPEKAAKRSLYLRKTIQKKSLPNAVGQKKPSKAVAQKEPNGAGGIIMNGIMYSWPLKRSMCGNLRSKAVLNAVDYQTTPCVSGREIELRPLQMGIKPAPVGLCMGRQNMKAAGHQMGPYMDDE